MLFVLCEESRGQNPVPVPVKSSSGAMPAVRSYALCKPWQNGVPHTVIGRSSVSVAKVSQSVAYLGQRDLTLTMSCCCSGY